MSYQGQTGGEKIKISAKYHIFSYICFSVFIAAVPIRLIRMTSGIIDKKRI